MTTSPRVGLFVTCLVNLFRPTVALAAIQLLEQAHYQVEVNIAQTCCGQPAYNSGDLANSRILARQVIDQFTEYDYIVIPSGSCASMLKHHYPRLFQNDPIEYAKAQDFAQRCYEFVTFLTEIAKISTISAIFEHTVTYHDACCGLRELQIKQQPRALLMQVAGLKLVEMANAETCCGFGGTFCVKYPEISTKMVSDKIDGIESSGAEVVLTGEMGCLLNIAGRLHRLKSPVKVYHIAEVLAAMTEN